MVRMKIPNRGQIIEQKLQKYGNLILVHVHGVFMVSSKARHSKRKLPGNISFPMIKPTKHHLCELKKKKSKVAIKFWGRRWWKHNIPPIRWIPQIRIKFLRPVAVCLFACLI